MVGMVSGKRQRRGDSKVRPRRIAVNSALGTICARPPREPWTNRRIDARRPPPSRARETLEGRKRLGTEVFRYWSRRANPIALTAYESLLLEGERRRSLPSFAAKAQATSSLDDLPDELKRGLKHRSKNKLATFKNLRTCRFNNFACGAKKGEGICIFAI